VSIKRGGSRRRLIGMAVALPIALVACLVIGFRIPPAASTDELPQSFTADGVVHDRLHLITLKTNRRDAVAVRVPVTSRPIVVWASCRLALLHGSSATSVLGLEMAWTRTGGDTPDTHGNDYLVCSAGRTSRLVQTLDPAWLPRTGDDLSLTWSEWPTLADAPSDSPASWALAVYVARRM